MYCYAVTMTYAIFLGKQLCIVRMEPLDLDYPHKS